MRQKEGTRKEENHLRPQHHRNLPIQLSTRSSYLPFSQREFVATEIVSRYPIAPKRRKTSI